MSLIDRKVTSSDITSKGVVAAPDTMTGTAAENKMVFDRLIREVIKDDLNGVIDDLLATTAAGVLGFAQSTNIPKSTVQEAIDYCYTSGAAGVAKALEYALKAEGYSVGKQDGTDVGSTSPYYHNNAKYYSENADTQATNASSSASAASTSASSAAGSATSAAGSATSAASSASAAASSATIANNKANEASGYATTAESAKSTAVTKASEASTSATNAAASATSASASATSATGSASTATTAATTASSAATTATSAATTASTGATTATTNALIAEGQAVGEQNGTAVSEGSPYYHRNAKWYAEHQGGDSMAFGTDDIVVFTSGNNPDLVQANPTPAGTTPLKGLQIGEDKYICGTHLTIGGVDYLLRTSTTEAGLAGYITFVVGA